MWGKPENLLSIICPIGTLAHIIKHSPFRLGLLGLAISQRTQVSNGPFAALPDSTAQMPSAEEGSSVCWGHRDPGGVPRGVSRVIPKESYHPVGCTVRSLEWHQNPGY